LSKSDEHEKAESGTHIYLAKDFLETRSSWLAHTRVNMGFAISNFVDGWLWLLWRGFEALVVPEVFAIGET